MQRVNGIRDLMAFLGSFGVRPEDTVKVWKVYGQDSVACIQEDPYRLCSDKIGISFAVADQLAESLEYDRDNKERVKAGVLYVLRHNLNNGTRACRRINCARRPRSFWACRRRVRRRLYLSCARRLRR